MNENGHLNSANIRLQRSQLSFSTKDLVLKRSKNIDCEPSVSMCYYDPLVAVLLTDPDLRLFTKLVDGSASSDVELDENIEGTPSSSSSSPLQQMELNQCGNSGRFDWTLLASVVQSRLPITKPTSCTLDSNFQSWRTGDSEIHRVGESTP